MWKVSVRPHSHLAEDDVADEDMAEAGDEEPPQPMLEIPRPSRQGKKRRVTTRRPSGQQTSVSLAAIRGKMNLANVKERTRASTTMVTHRREIEKLVLWFYDHHRHLIGEAFGATLKLYDDKLFPEDNNGVEKERSAKSESLMRRQIEVMVGKAPRN